MINKVWYRVQKAGQIIKPGPENVYFCTNDFEYIDNFIYNVDDPEVLVFSVDPNMRVVDLYDKPFSSKCGYPELADVLSHSESFPTAFSALPDIAKIDIDSDSASPIHVQFQQLNDELYFLDNIVDAPAEQQLDLVKWARTITDRTKRKYGKADKAYKIAIGDLLAHEPGLAGILDFEGSLILIDPSVMRYVMSGLKPLTSDEFKTLYDQQLDVMQSDDPAKVFDAIKKMRGE